MKKLNVAIIGQGRSGRDIHGAYFHADDRHFVVKAVVDELEFRRERAVKEYPGADIYADYHELFGRKDIDLVVNSTYSNQHVSVSMELLKAGFNVLSEKPCARYPEEVQMLADEARKQGKVFAVFQQSRFAPYYEKVKSIVDSGVLGRIIQVNVAFNGFARRWDWQTLQGRNGGSLMNTGPHPVDQALRFLDYDGMPNVFCKMDRVNTFGDAEDYVKLILTAPDRPLVDVEISSCDAYPSFTYKIMGSLGGLTGSMTKIDWKYYSRIEAPEQHLTRESLRDAEGRPMYCGEKLTWTQESWEVPDARTFTYAARKYYDELYDLLTEGKPMSVKLEQVKQQIAVMAECHRQNSMSRLD